MKKLAGILAISEGLIYIIAFVIFGAMLQFPAAAPEQTLAFLKQNYAILYVMTLLIYVVFGFFLAVVVWGIHQYIHQVSPNLAKVTQVFGFIWVGLVIAAGMIGNVALHKVTHMSDTQQAFDIWQTVGIITEGLGGGNEVVGGVWVLLLSLAVFKDKTFPRFLFFLGMIVGLAGIFTIYPLEIFTEIFGLTQIIWFIGIGIFLLRRK